MHNKSIIYKLLCSFLLLVLVGLGFSYSKATASSKQVAVVDTNSVILDGLQSTAHSYGTLPKEFVSSYSNIGNSVLNLYQKTGEAIWNSTLETSDQLAAMANTNLSASLNSQDASALSSIGDFFSWLFNLLHPRNNSTTATTTGEVLYISSATKNSPPPSNNVQTTTTTVTKTSNTNQSSSGTSNKTTNTTTIIQNGVSESELNSKLLALDQNLRALIFGAAPQSGAAPVINNYITYAGGGVIGNFSGPSNADIQNIQNQITNLQQNGGGNPFNQSLNTTDSPTFNNLTLNGNLNLSSLPDGCLETSSGTVVSTGVNCGSGGGGITSLNGQTGSTQTFATSSSGSNFSITSSGNVHTFNLPSASASNRGLLTSADWTTFNNKQAAGNYITALTGDVTASGPGSAAATLATVNSNIGTFNNVTVNGKGLVTSASNVSYITSAGAPVQSVFGRTGAVTAQSGDYTTDQVTEGTNKYYTDALARAALSSTATGLTYTSGTGVFSLTSGYNIPLTASTTDWQSFFTTPSSRITAGTGLSWSGNTLNATSTFGTVNSGLGGYFGYYPSTGTTIDDQSVLYTDGTNIGIGTTTLTNLLTLISTTTPQFRVGYDSSNYFTTSVGSNGLLTLAVNGSTGGMVMTNPQPASVSGMFGTSATTSFTVIGATGGNTSITGGAFGGAGGGIQLMGGVGGVPTHSDTGTKFGGVGGKILISGGTGATPSVGLLARSSGSGGSVTITGGIGANSSSGSSGGAGSGGILYLLGGQGGNAFIDSFNGIGGDVVISGGPSGSGGSSGGAPGNVFIAGGATTSTSTLVGDVYIGATSTTIARGNVYFGKQQGIFNTSTGYLGIGTTTPNFLLTVAGTSNFTNELNFNGAPGALGQILQSFGSGAAPQWVATSTLGLLSSTSGDWTGTFDGQEGSYYLARANHTGTQLASTISDFASTARGLFSSTATGLTYTSGTGAFSLTSGYNIPLTASTTDWASFFDTPSSRISAGTGLSWSTNTLNSVWTKSGNDIYNNTSGNVGIGTTTPGYKLTVSGDTNLTGALRNNGDAGSNGYVLQSTGSGIQWVATSTLGISGGAVTSVSNSDGTLTISPTTGAVVASLALGHANTWTGTQTFNNSTYSALFTGGNVGIGTTTPTATLHVQGSGTTNPFVVSSSTGSALFTVDKSGNITIPGAGIINIGATTISGASIDTSSGDYTIHGSTGVVNIGNRLSFGNGAHLSQIGSVTDGVIFLENFAQNDFSRLTFGGTTSAFPALGRNGTSLYVELADGTNGGNFGIGTSTPGSLLTVAGNALITGNLTVNGATNSTSTINGNLVVSGNIVPSVDNTYSLGSASLRWKDLFVGPGSIYINGQEVLHTDPSNDVNVSADTNQSIRVKTSGTGDIDLNPTGSGQILLKGNPRLSAGYHFNVSDGSASIFTGGIAPDNISIIGNTISTTNTNGNFSFSPNGSGQTYFTSGNVGIGTTTPGYKLTVSGDTNITGALRSNGDAGSNGYVLQSTGSGFNWVATSTLGFASATTTSALTSGLTLNYVPKWNSSAFTNSLIYDDGTNVGIGTTTPATKLDVYNTNGSPGFAGEVVGLSGTAQYTSNGSPSVYAVKAFPRNTSNGSSNLYGLYSNPANTSNGAPTMYGVYSLLSNTGNGAVPNAYGAYLAAPSNTGAGSITNYYGLYLQTPTAAGTNFALYSQGGTNYFGGNVGIGTTTPGYKLTVGGDVNITGALRSNGDAGSNGYVLQSTGSGFNWVATSTLGISGGAVTSVSNADGTLTISPTTGAVVASLALGHANTWTGQQTFNTSSPIFGTMTQGSVFYAGSGGLLSQDNSNLFYDDTNHRLGLGTTTPASKLQVLSTTEQLRLGYDASNYTKFTVGSTSGLTLTPGVNGTSAFNFTKADGTTSILNIDSTNARVGIGTTTPYAFLTVGGSAAFSDFSTYSTTSTSTIPGGLSVGNGSLNYDWSSGVTSIDNLQLGAFSFDTNAGIVSWADMPVTSAASTGTIESYSAQISGTPLLTVYSESAGSGGIQNGRIGIGTSTPSQVLDVWGNLNVATSSTPLLFANTAISKIGIGTSSPLAKLDIYGTAGSADIFAVSSSTNSRLLTLSSAGNLGIGTSTPGSLLDVWGNLNIATGTTPALFVNTATTRVGIGTSTPAYPLDIWGALNVGTSTAGLFNANPATGNVVITSASQNAFAVGPNGTTNPAFQIDASTTSAVNGLRLTPSASSSGVLLETISSGPNEDLTIRSKGTGNMILDTTATGGGVILEVNGTSKATFNQKSATFSVSARTGGSGTAYTFNGAADTAIAASAEALDFNFGFGDIKTHSAGALTLQRSILATAPTYAFNTSTSTLTDAATFGINSAPLGGNRASITNTHALLISAGALTGVITNSYGLTVNAQTGATNNYAAQFLGGNVGIATSSPTYKLVVAGTVALPNLTSESGSNGSAVCLSGANEVVVNAGVTCTLSSERYKHGITDSSTGLDEIMNLRPVTFYYNNDTNNTDQQYGFIAEEVQKIDPRLVQLDKNGIPQTVRYEEFTAILAKGVQELNSKVDNQNASTTVALSALDLRVKSLESLGIGAGASSGGAGLGGTLLSTLQSFGSEMLNGLAYISHLFTKQLTVGSPDHRNGITLYDQATGEPYCLFIKNGATQTTAGECQDVTATSTEAAAISPIPPPPAPPIDTGTSTDASSTPPVVTPTPPPDSSPTSTPPVTPTPPADQTPAPAPTPAPTPEPTPTSPPSSGDSGGAAAPAAAPAESAPSTP